MEEFVVDVAPSSPRKNVTATLSDLQQKPQQFFEGSDIVWMLLSSGLVWLMVPAMCLFYSGASTRLSSLKLFRLPLITAAFVGFQWYFWGYTLAFTPAVPPSGGAAPGVSWYGWDTSGLALKGPLVHPVGNAGGPQIPEMVYELYQGMFACFTAALVSGGSIRGNPNNRFPSSDVPVGRFLIFINLWSLIVYIPVARWTWHWAGWSNQRGVLDFAGGTAVHITSGTACLAFYLFHARHTKKSRAAGSTPGEHAAGLPFDYDRYQLEEVPRPTQEQQSQTTPDLHSQQQLQPASNGIISSAGPTSAAPSSVPTAAVTFPAVRGNNRSPHNVNNVVLGTGLLWIGWLGFNGGSALGGNMRAVSSCVSTHVAACAGGSTSLLLFWFWNSLARRHDRKSLPEATNETKKAKRRASRGPSVTEFCDGVVVGLVAITPGAGFVPIWSSAVFGVVAAFAVFFLKKMTGRLLADKPLYVFAIHTGGGTVGMILTGVFASHDVVALDGYSQLIFPERTPGVRVGYQLLDVLAGFSYTLCMTTVILYGLKVVRFILRGKWSAGFKVLQKPGRWKLEAMPQTEWRREAERPPMAPNAATAV